MNAIYIRTLWDGITAAEKSGFNILAQALRAELAAELLKADRRTFFQNILSLPR
jgi:hypothetical protein